MEDPDFAKLLRYLYENQGLVYVTVSAPEHQVEVNEQLFDELRKEVDFSEKLDDDAPFANMLSNLDDLDMIEWEQDGNSSSLHLQPKGFEVAHERELRNQREVHNRVLAAFTVLLGISALIQALSILSTTSLAMQLIMAFLIISGALTFLYVLKGKASVFVE